MRLSKVLNISGYVMSFSQCKGCGLLLPKGYEECENKILCKHMRIERNKEIHLRRQGGKCFGCHQLLDQKRAFYCPDLIGLINVGCYRCATKEQECELCGLKTSVLAEKWTWKRTHQWCENHDGCYVCRTMGTVLMRSKDKKGIERMICTTLECVWGLKS